MANLLLVQTINSESAHQRPGGISVTLTPAQVNACSFFFSG